MILILPLKIVFTVAKYEPIGNTTMAKVKARSLNMTPLTLMSIAIDSVSQEAYIRWHGRRNIGFLQCCGRERGRIALFEESFLAWYSSS